MRLAGATALMLVMAGCGSAATTSAASSTPTARSAPTATPTAVTALTATAAQSIGVAKALFPLGSGGYTECDGDVTHTAACPFDARLRSQVAMYAANWQRACPNGCGGGGGLLIGGQCAIFANESITTAVNPAMAIVALAGQICDGHNQTMYVPVIVENGLPLADDVECNAGDPKYGLYTLSLSTTSQIRCAPA
jgi:hypothetical protein